MLRSFVSAPFAAVVVVVFWLSSPLFIFSDGIDALELHQQGVRGSRRRYLPKQRRDRPHHAAKKQQAKKKIATKKGAKKGQITSDEQDATLLQQLQSVHGNEGDIDSIKPPILSSPETPIEGEATTLTGLSLAATASPPPTIPTLYYSSQMARITRFYVPRPESNSMIHFEADVIEANKDRYGFVRGTCKYQEGEEANAEESDTLTEEDPCLSNLCFHCDITWAFGDNAIAGFTEYPVDSIETSGDRLLLNDTTPGVAQQVLYVTAATGLYDGIFGGTVTQTYLGDEAVEGMHEMMRVEFDLQ